MLNGEQVRLRLIERRDIPVIYKYQCDPDNRGFFYPISIKSRAELLQKSRTDGFWSEDEGTMAIINHDDTLVGLISFFRPSPMDDALEVAYILFAADQRGRGYTSEALRLFVEFLFGSRPIERIQLNVAAENEASIHVAEHCSFVREGVVRSAWYAPRLGCRIDGYRYSLLRSEWQAQRTQDSE